MGTNVHNKTDSVKPSAKTSEVRSKGAAEPASGRKQELSTKQFCTVKPTVHWVADGWTCMSWEGSDGQPGGYVVTNGNSAMFFDETGNMTLSTGKPAQSGCGGKLIINSTDQIHNAQGTISIHAKGPSDATRTADSRGSKGESTKESHAYSVYAEGAIAIESQGEEVGIKGDNIVINALKTLTLKAGEAINIECGDGNGKVNIYTGDYNLNAAFNNKTVSGGDYTDGAGEKTVNTTQPGAVEATNSIGTINRAIKGNYYLGVEGHYNLNVLANINLKSKIGGFGLSVIGKSYEKIGGVKEEIIAGVMPAVDGKKVVPTATYDMRLGPNKHSFKLKALNGFDVKAYLGTSTFKLYGGKVDVKIGGTLTVKALTIFLN